MVRNGKISDTRIGTEVRRALEDMDNWKEEAVQMRKQFEYCVRCDEDTLRINGKCTRCARKDYESNRG